MNGRKSFEESMVEDVRPCGYARSLVLNICVGFMAVVVLVLILGSLFAGEENQQGIFYGWSCLAVCVVAGILQMLCFTPIAIKRMGYPARLALFGIGFFPILSLCAWVLRWFPVDKPGAWAGFAVGYLLIFAVMTGIFTVLYRSRAKEMNERLAEYRSRVSNEKGSQR